jgi:hypothetical protein
MVTVLNPREFKLPRIEKEKFIVLLRAGLEYNREQGTFCIKSYNNIEKLKEIIAEILNTEVVFMPICTRCGKAFACSECNYNEHCATKDLPFDCVCPLCLKEKKNFE